MDKELEKYFLFKEIEGRYSTKIIESKTPADGKNRRVCLFIKLDNQDELTKKYDNLELDIYLFLRDKLVISEHYDSIALI